MKKCVWLCIIVFVWWHRRRAAHHVANGVWWKSHGGYANFNRCNSWSEWHLKQIERLTK